MYWTTVSNPRGEGDSRGWTPWEAPPAVEEPDVCRFFQTTGCRFGAECHNIHVMEGASLRDDPDYEAKRSRWLTRSRDASVACEVCSEEPVSRNRKFGILENCSHVFCLECIREWRRQREQQDRINLRRCPVCRVESFIILPSDVLIRGERKLQELEIYKSSLAKIPCKYRSLTACPFGSSCLYHHEVSDALPVPRILRGADGKKKPKTSNTLSDYF